MTYLSPEQSPAKRSARATAASQEFPKAFYLASEKGLLLTKPSDIHYQLSPKDRSWILNIYPSNRRLYHDRNKSTPPYLDLPDDWTLLGVVRAAVGHA